VEFCGVIDVASWFPLLVLLTTLHFQEGSGTSVQQQPPAASPIPVDVVAPPRAPESESSKSPAKKQSEPSPKSPKSRTKKPDRAKSRSTTAVVKEEVRVRSQAEMRKPKSPFLLSPGGSPEDRYGPDADIDWLELPPWRQTSFFGVRAKGLFFVYVVDCSGSMIDDDRMPRATIELRRSVMALREPQRFEVIFYNSESIPMPGGPIPRSATLQAKSQLRSFLQLIDPDGGTDPRPAMKQALSLRPDAVFLLSDGAFPDGTAEELTRLNKHKVPIHCVDLTGGLAGDHLKRIAAANGGQYASRMGDLQGRP
jgi:von Willebrand factor type A domain